MIPSTFALFGNGPATAALMVTGLGPFVWLGLTALMLVAARIAYDAWSLGVESHDQPRAALIATAAVTRRSQLHCVRAAGSGRVKQTAKPSVADAA